MTPTTEAPVNNPMTHRERVPFDQVQTPGCYVQNNTGILYRIPEEALSTGRSPLIEMVCKADTTVTKISQDPWIPISKARQLTADADLYPNF
jgi:hypothetical protein